jgi:hypothetical protein
MPNTMAVRSARQGGHPALGAPRGMNQELPSAQAKRGLATAKHRPHIAD